MSSSRSSRLLRECRRFAVAATLSLVLPLAREARAWDADEVADLRVTHAAGSVALTWQAPATTPGSYIVRRCTLPALRGGQFGAPYFGDCIATGLTATSFDEVEPAGIGGVFYLVSGSFGGVEGSLGDSWNGRSFVPRTGPDCSTPSRPGPLTLIVRILEPVHICGTDVRILYPEDAVTFVSADCTGIQAPPSFFGVTNGTIPGRVYQACASANGASGPGEIMRFEFQRSSCPARQSVVDVTKCRVLVGNPDCASNLEQDLTCVLSAQ